MTTKIYMQIIFIFSILATMSSCSDNSDWNRHGLNGKVKTYLERSYEAEMKFGEWENGDLLYYGHHRVFFDKKGNYQWIEYLDNDNELSGKSIPKREKGKVVEDAHYDKYGKLESKVKFTNNSSNSIEFITYNNDGRKINQGISLIKNNRIIRQEYKTYKDKEVKNENTIVFEYNKNGDLISQKQTNKKGEITSFFKFEYLSFDDNNNWTKRLEYDSEEGEEPSEIVIREYEYY